MKLVYSTLSGLAVSATIDDDAVLLSTGAMRSSLGADSMSTLVDFAQEGSPRKAQKLLQTFAKNTLGRSEEVDDVTKEKLKEIAAQLTNNTWMALEQAHRRDQDLLNKHWNAIQMCGDKHLQHLKQDVDSLEVALVRTHESDMMQCRGLPDHADTHQTALLQKGDDKVGGRWDKEDFYKEGSLVDGVEYKATDLWGDGYGGISNEAFEAKYGMTKPAFDKTYSPYQGVWKVDRDPETGKLNGQRYFAHVSDYYKHDPFGKVSLLERKNIVCEKCGELDAFLAELPASKPNCEPTLIATTIDPQCTTEEKPLIETDLDQWFDNLVTFADFNLEKWQKLKAACDAARADYKKMDERCDEEQQQYETSFCSYRQGLHSTCAEYQGCHILTEEQFLALIQDSLYAADSRKIDWKAIHKIACYIKVLVSDGTNVQRTLALDNCESGDLNTLSTILMGFNETNYLSLIIPEISGNVSCWDLDVPPLIDFKECDMSSVHQYPCTPTWMDRYEGLESPGDCVACAALPDHMMYSDKDYQGYAAHAKSTEYGGGWIFVNELGRSSEDINDLTQIQPDGYMLPSYNMKGLRWNEVLVQRTSPNWCDSWGKQSSKWVESDGASMCVQADNDHVYCMNNHKDKHQWMQQPTSHFAALCSKGGVNTCECWPYEEGRTNICFAEHVDNKPAPRHVTIHSLEEDGSVVKVSFRGEEKTGVLRVGNYGSFLDGVGCGAVTPVSYRVYVRCLGCTTERSDFHSKDGAQFVSAMTMATLGKAQRAQYTYEGWFKSPLEGNFRREIFGGTDSGLVLVNENKVECKHYGQGTNEKTGYMVHVGNSRAFSNFCFQKNMFYHIAVTKESGKEPQVFVNGHPSTSMLESDTTEYGDSHITSAFGGGFTDGGQLFNVRIWNYARSKDDLLEYSAVTNPDNMGDDAEHPGALAHWWPLTGNTKDLMTGTSLQGKDVRYAPVWCSDLEATGMRVC
jgi:hypothetical protein